MKLSFIVSLFNKEQFIDRCINSFLSMTLEKSEFEVIFVDDCSTDCSVNIVKQYQRKFDFIHLYSTNENSGSPAKPRNMGIKKARGEYIAIIDADDWIDGKGFSHLIKQMTLNNSDIGFGKSFKHTSKRTYQIARFSSFKTANHLIPYEIKNIFRALGPPGKVFKKSLVEDNYIKFKEFKYGEDKLFFAELIAKARSASMINETIYHVDRYPHNNSLVKQTNIISRVPLNLNILEELCKLDINITAKTYILERMIEADFLKGLLIRKEFIESNEQSYLIHYIDKVQDILKKYDFNMRSLIKEPMLKNVYNLYIKKDIVSLSQYIKYLLSNKKKLIVNNQIELPNTSGIEVSYPLYINFYPIYNGTIQDNGKNYTTIKMLKDLNTHISKVYIMEKANEENIKEIPFEIKKDMIFIDDSYLNLEASVFNILIYVNDFEAHLVYSSYPYMGANIMNRQEFKLEFKNPYFNKKNPIDINQYISTQLRYIKTHKKVPIYKDFNFSTNNIVDYVEKDTILESVYQATLVNGGSAFKIKDRGFILGLKENIIPVNEASSQYYYNLPKTKTFIIKHPFTINDKENKKFQYNEGELIFVNHIDIEDNIAYFILDKGNRKVAKRSYFAPFNKRNYDKYILDNVTKIKITKSCYLYPDRNFKKQAIKKLKPKTKLKIDKVIFNDNSVPRFKTKEGYYLTTNKDFIEVLK